MERTKCWIHFLQAIAAIAAVSFILAGTQVMAQSTAQISGVVTDQSGAILPGVEVKVTQTDTGITRSAFTNETGLYILPNLSIGPYRLEAALPGFRSYVRTGIVLQVGSNPVLDILMEVGQVSETVEVQADAALVETR
ncbi:MAG: TonB-dependent receptor, partial [Acidobacteria bacterium]